MYTTISFLFHLLLISFVIGPLGKLPFDFAQGGVYVTDVVVTLICLFWIFHVPALLTLLRKDAIVKYFALFSAVAFFSLLFSPLSLSFFERLVSAAYLVRFLAYFGIYVTMKYLTKENPEERERHIRYLGYAGILLALVGWLQYILYPDLRNLYYLGWDPHYKRIFSTFLDPNFLGLILTLTILIFLSDTKLLPLKRTLILIFLGVTLAFTYSRSSFLALLSALLFFSLSKKNMHIIGIGALLLLLSIILLPRPGGEGVKLERVFSITERLESWKQGIIIFARHPVLGVGFNTLRFAKREYGGLSEDWASNHAGAGIENSFIFLGATTGIVGLFSYLFLFTHLFRYGKLLTRISLIAIGIHALFLNSPFFPWIMLWMWMIAVR